jgi:GNAT superfamily N-acetyltransferase
MEELKQIDEIVKNSLEKKEKIELGLKELDLIINKKQDYFEEHPFYVKVKPEAIKNDGKFTALYKEMMTIYSQATGGKDSKFLTEEGAEKLLHYAKEGLVFGAFSGQELLGYAVGADGHHSNFSERDIKTENMLTEVGYLQPFYIFGCELAVKPDMQKKGIGSKLVRKFLNSCYNLSFTFDMTNPKTAHFYVQKLGAAVTKYSKDAFGPSKGRAVYNGELFDRENKDTFTAFNKKESIEELAGEPIFEIFDMNKLYNVVEDKKPLVFNLKLCGTCEDNKNELNNLFDFVINKNSYALTDIVCNDGSFYYRFQSPESITNSHIEILAGEPKTMGLLEKARAARAYVKA